MDDTNAVVAGVTQVISSSIYATDFHAGLLLGLTIVVGCLGLSMLRGVTGDREEGGDF
jgi:hypothetical protein